MVNDMEEKFKKRLNEFRMIQGELKTIKEFRKQKANMEQDLNNVCRTIVIILFESMLVKGVEHIFLFFHSD